MILRQYISDGVTNVLAIAFLVLAIFSFGYAEYFDRLFIAFLVGILIFNARNANIVSIALIFLLERSIEEVIFFSSTLPLVKPFIYLASLYLIRVLWYDPFIKRFVLPSIVLCLVSELYWHITAYNAPRLHSYIAMLMLNMVTRHLIFMRVPIFQKLQIRPLWQKQLTTPVTQIPIDLPLYSLAMGYGLVVIAMLGEYLIRHMTSFSPLVVYDFYPYAMQLLAVATLFFITHFIIKPDHKITA